MLWVSESSSATSMRCHIIFALIWDACLAGGSGIDGITVMVQQLPAVHRCLTESTVPSARARDLDASDILAQLSNQLAKQKESSDEEISAPQEGAGLVKRARMAAIRCYVQAHSSLDVTCTFQTHETTLFPRRKPCRGMHAPGHLAARGLQDICRQLKAFPYLS